MQSSVLAGIVILAGSLAWTLLSFHFRYGEGHEERPILLFLLVYGAMWAAFIWVALGLRAGSAHPSLGWVLVVALLCRAALLPSGLIQENDVYRYVLDGQVILHSQNPYRFSPAEVEALAPPSLRSSLSQPEAQLTLSRIGYPEIPTIYPPAAQAAFAAGAALGGWNWMGQRWIFLGIDLATLAALGMFLKWFQLPLVWLLFYAWNPLILKEVINSVHHDGLVAILLVLLLLILARFERGPGAAGAAWAGTVLGLAVLSKLYPAVLIPACLLMLRRRSTSWRVPATFLGTTGAVIALGYLPFLAVGLGRLIEGLRTYAADWRMNEGLFGLFDWVAPGFGWLAGATAAGFAVALPAWRRPENVSQLTATFQWILLLWFLCLPAVYPWYAVPLVALLVLRPQGAPALAVLVLSGATSLYYLSFYFEYHATPPAWWFWTRLIEHGVIWATLAAAASSEICRGRLVGFIVAKAVSRSAVPKARRSPLESD